MLFNKVVWISVGTNYALLGSYTYPYYFVKERKIYLQKILKT